MTINILGLSIDLLAVTIFMISTLLVTEIVKAYINPSFYAKAPLLIPLVSSWIIGAICFRLCVLFSNQKLNLNTIIQFVLFTALLNGGYNLIKPVIKTWLLSLGIDIDRKPDHDHHEEEIKEP